MNSCTVFSGLCFFFTSGFLKSCFCDSERFDGEVEKLIINMVFKVFGPRASLRKSLSVRGEDNCLQLKFVKE
jgi:hypothetical protein